MTTPTVLPSATETRPTFDEAVCAKIKECFQRIFVEHPEVAALSASVVWRGELNNAHINHGVWVSADGPGGVAAAPDVIFGSIHQTIRLLEQQVGRAVDLITMLRERVVVLGTELARKEGTREETARSQIQR